MKILRVRIDGYGRFSGVEKEFAPGLQVVIGPNEQGKTTLRCFIVDMLYGQKRSPTRNIYDEAHQLRIPWENPDRYGGALVYRIDSGREIEVTRVFDKRRESVQVYDRTRARDIGSEFEMLRNRELDFAAAHLGLGKEVFLGAANIGHFSLEDLGDRDALDAIRSKLLTLADSGDESFPAEACLRLLAARIASIGQPSARTKPLPAARARLAELNQEYEQALLLQQQLEDTVESRQTLLEENAGLREEKLRLEEAARALALHERARRLREAEAIQRRIDEITQQSFARSAARDFPAERTPEVQRAENVFNTARQQLERSRGELRQLRQQVLNERRQAGAEEPLPMQEVPESFEKKQAELNAYLANVRVRIEDTARLVEAARVRVGEAQQAVAELPDFTRIANDPVEWFTQLASAFSVALRSRDEECNLRARLRAEVDERRGALDDLDGVFGETENFPELVREYELGRRVQKEQTAHANTRIQRDRTARGEVREKMPGLVLLAAACAAFMLVLVTTFFVTGHTPMLVAVAATTLATAYFSVTALYARMRLKGYGRAIAEAEAELAALEAGAGARAAEVEALLERAGCGAVRELEAKYDQYRESRAHLQGRLEVLEEQEQRALEAEERIPQLLARYTETFAQAGETIASEEDIKDAAGRAIARYQDFRERKRRAHDSRTVWERHQAEARRLQDAERQCADHLAKLEEKVRAFMRDQGFADERLHEDLGAAVKSYAKRVSRHREQRARIDLLEEKAEHLESQVHQEEIDLERARQDLHAMLAKAGVGTVHEWHALAEQAREYRDLWARRTGLQDQLHTLLRGEDLAALRRQAEAGGDLPDAPPQSADELQAALAGIQTAIDANTREAHALHVALAERAAGTRPLNEIEEDRAALQRRVALLEREHEATAYAMALIEDIASDKHARIAPKLAAIASAYLAGITEGAYGELMIGRDLSVGVRIPGINRMHESPEKSLSKGTVDQVYFALRLAMVQAMSENGESIPMLLDDPFANYDDTRLERTMQLLAQLGERAQILLFTCREDVARAAEAVNAPIMRL